MTENNDPSIAPRTIMEEFMQTFEALEDLRPPEQRVTISRLEPESEPLQINPTLCGSSYEKKATFVASVSLVW